MDVFPERCYFYVEAYSKMGAIHSNPIGDPDFLRGADRIVKKIRDEENRWHTLETYVGRRTEMSFSQALCPECKNGQSSENSQ